MTKFTLRMPTLIMAMGIIFFALLTYYFQYSGDGEADGLGMFFFIIIVGLARLGFLLAFLRVLFFTSKGDTVFKIIISGIVLVTVCFVI